MGGAHVRVKAGSEEEELEDKAIAVRKGEKNQGQVPEEEQEKKYESLQSPLKMTDFVDFFSFSSFFFSRFSLPLLLPPIALYISLFSCLWLQMLIFLCLLSIERISTY